MSTVPLVGDNFDITKYEGMSARDMMFAMRRDLEFKMPPVGKTESRCIIGGQEYRRVTWRCDQPNCWYMVVVSSDDQLNHAIKLHNSGTAGESNCPTAPRRESLPSGLAEIEKLWREIDDVIDAMKVGGSYRGMMGLELKAYVKGIAFSVVMKDKELFPDIKSVAAEGLKRWKMRHGQLPHEATPTRHTNDFSSLGVSGGWQPVSPAKKAAPPAKKAAPRKAAAPAVQPLSADKQRDVKAALASGMFTPEDIAVMYGVTISQVKSVQ